MQFSTVFTALMAATAVSAVAIPTDSTGDVCEINETNGNLVCLVGNVITILSRECPPLVLVPMLCGKQC
jgi:hypothetical protein